MNPFRRRAKGHPAQTSTAARTQHVVVDETGASVRSLCGQVLFVEFDGARVRVDLVLSKVHAPNGTPVTLVVELAGDRASQLRARQLLGRWADETAVVVVDVTDGLQGVGADRVRFRPARHAT